VVWGGALTEMVPPGGLVARGRAELAALPPCRTEPRHSGRSSSKGTRARAARPLALSPRSARPVLGAAFLQHNPRLDKPTTHLFLHDARDTDRTLQPNERQVRFFPLAWASWWHAGGNAELG
jgi:hypothetical protein